MKSKIPSKLSWLQKVLLVHALWRVDSKYGPTTGFKNVYQLCYKLEFAYHNATGAWVRLRRDEFTSNRDNARKAHWRAVNRLVQRELVQRNEDGWYQPTPYGIEVAKAIIDADLEFKALHESIATKDAQLDAALAGMRESFLVDADLERIMSGRRGPREGRRDLWRFIDAQVKAKQS
jgi:hypothetical protein